MTLIVKFLLAPREMAARVKSLSGLSGFELLDEFDITWSVDLPEEFSHGVRKVIQFNTTFITFKFSGNWELYLALIGRDWHAGLFVMAFRTRPEWLPCNRRQLSRGQEPISENFFGIE